MERKRNSCLPLRLVIWLVWIMWIIVRFSISLTKGRYQQAKIGDREAFVFQN